MDELKQILYYKLRFIQNYKGRETSTIQQKQKIVEQFLKERKKQNSRDVIQSRLLQTLSTRKIEAPYRIEEFYNQSTQMMRIFDPSFAFQSINLNDGIASIVYLYIDFFNKQKCTRRSQQLKHIFEKNLCERNMIIPTIFNWFAEWLKKEFREFIKRTLHQYNEKAHSTSVKQSKRVRYKKFLQEISSQKASLAAIDTQIKIHQELTIKANRSKLLLSPAPDIKNLKYIAKSEILRSSPRNQSLSFVKLNTNINSSILEKQIPSKLQQTNEGIRDRPNLNKDIFFSAYYEQILAYYKFHSCLQQLDDTHPRSFRKVDRREEITKNLDILTKSMSRNQPNQIKNSIQQYFNMYYTKFKDSKLKKRSSSVKVKSKKMQQSFEQEQKQRTEISKQQILQSQITDGNTSKASPIKKRQFVNRIQAQKKRIEIELPDIRQNNSFKSVEKIILVHDGSVPLNRYNRGNKSTRVSAELYKELREINGLFRKRKHSIVESLSFDQSNIEDRVNQIKFKKNEASQLLEHCQPDGIFRLPKINK